MDEEPGPAAPPAENQYLEDVKDSYLSTASLITLAKQYFPVTLTDSIEPPCDMCWTHDCAHPKRHFRDYTAELYKMGMYKTCKDLTTDLLKFRSFPGSRETLGLDICDSYSAYGRTYKNLKDTPYIAKQDVFVFLNNMILELFPDTEWFIPCMCYELLLKFYEEQLGESLEFIEWTSDVSLDVQRQFTDLMTKFLKDEDERNERVTLDELVERVQSFVEWDLERHAALERLKEYHEYYVYWKTCWPVVQSIKEIVEANQFHVPNEQLEPAKRSRPYVRHFIMNDTTKCVMFEELVQGASKLTPLAMRQTVLATEQQLRKELSKRKDNVEVLLTPIFQTKWRSVPIRLKRGMWCKLAFDVFFEVLVDLILGHKVFHKAQGARWELVKSFAKELEKYFVSDKKDPYFITGEKIEELKEFTKTHFAPLADIPAESLNLGELQEPLDTFENLKVLKISETFPYIERTARRVDKELEEPSGEILRSDVVDGIVDTVVTEFLRMFPRLQEFVHNQKGCHEVLLSNCCPRT